MLKHDSHIRMEAKRRALDATVAKKADAKPAEEKPVGAAAPHVSQSGGGLSVPRSSTVN